MIKSLDEFTDFLKICRKQGVTSVTFSGISVDFGELPKKQKNDTEDREIPTDELSQEELMFFSAGGAPNENHKG